MDTWRMLDLGPLPAWKQMALDKVVIEARARDSVPNTLRFMEFYPPTALIGYHQSVDLEINRSQAERLGVEINRRITGGGAIYMDAQQLGWEICMKVGASQRIRPESLYPQLAQVVVEALGSWGIKAHFRPVNDVEVDGRKISGTGGVDYYGTVIYQGTLLLDFDVKTMLEVLRLPVEKLSDKSVTSFAQRLVTMRELLGQSPPMDEVKERVQAALMHVLGVRLVPSSLTDFEADAWQQSAETYRMPQWIDRRKPPQPDANYPLKNLTYKASGGLLRLTVQTNMAMTHIKAIFITGDFFVYPERAVLDLEAALKDAPLEIHALQSIVKQHYRTGYQYLGVKEEDWIAALSPLCLNRREGSL
ncbi:MAG: lipoate--protein ligase family protein [Sulfobacillus thermotolerans]|nr:lipoate--protein ligase family protein [Sulfobacillus thermotolerans]